jgi:hypothetical protein
MSLSPACGAYGLLPVEAGVFELAVGPQAVKSRAASMNKEM